MDNAEQFFPPGGVPFLNYNNQSSGNSLQPSSAQQRAGPSRRPNMNPARTNNLRKRPPARGRDHTVTALTNNAQFRTSSARENTSSNFIAPLPFAAGMSSMAMMNTHGYDMTGAYEYGFDGYEMPVGPMYNPNMAHNHSQQMQHPAQQQQQPRLPEGPQQQQPGAAVPPKSHQESQPAHDSNANPQPKKKIVLPDGKDDLEILEKLKRIILDNQHPFYKAIPKPEYLASLYKGKIPTGSVAKASVPAAKTDVAMPAVKEEPISGGVGGVSASEAAVKSIGAPVQGNAAQPGRATKTPPAVREATPLARAAPTETAATTPPKKKSVSPPLAPVTSSPQSPSSVASTAASAVPAVPHRLYSPAIVDVKPVVSPSHVGEDSMQVDVPPQPATVGAPPVQTVPSFAGITSQISKQQGFSPSPVPGSVTAVSAQQQSGQSIPGLHAPVSHKPAQAVPVVPVSAPTKESVPLGGTPFSKPSIPPVTSAVPSVATDFVPFGGDSSVIPGLGPVISSTGFTPAPLSAQASVQSIPDTVKRSPAAPAPPVPQAARPLHVPVTSGPPPAASSMARAPEQDVKPILKERVEQPPLLQPRPAGQAPSEAHPHPHPHAQERNTNHHNNNFKGRNNKKNQQSQYHPPPKSGDRNSFRPSDGPAPPPPSSGNASLRAPPFRGRSPLPGKMPVSPGSRAPPPPPRDYRGPPAGRSLSRDRDRDRGNYSRPPPPLPVQDFEPRRDALDMDGPPPGRYDSRSSYPEYHPTAPPPLSGGRAPPPADVGRGDYYGSYAPSQPPPSSAGSLQERGARWEGDPYYKRDWDRGPAPPPPASADRGRFDREYEPTQSWDRPDRDFPDREALYSRDDGYTPREPERARPPAPYTPTYSRVRGRSPSPLGRPGAGDPSRPPVKRAREDFGPEYYPGPGGGGALNSGGRPPVRRGPPGGGGGGGGPPDWVGGGPPPPGSASSLGGGGDYHSSMEYAPPPDSYDRGRSPPPVSGGGRASYGGGGGGRATYNRGPDRYGPMRAPP